jgi:hypothetical protein
MDVREPQQLRLRGSGRGKDDGEDQREQRGGQRGEPPWVRGTSHGTVRVQVVLGAAGAAECILRNQGTRRQYGGIPVGCVILLTDSESGIRIIR